MPLEYVKLGGEQVSNFALSKRGAFRIVNFAVIKVGRRVARFFEIINVRGKFDGKNLGREDAYARSGSANDLTPRRVA